MIKPVRCAVTVALVAWMVGCGDGPPSPYAYRNGSYDWVAGEFVPSDVFRAKCESPRTGTNPATNQPYPDVEGSTVDENNFLRSFSNETYLWYGEIVDRNPALFSDSILYFDGLKTDAVTSSGRPKDRFHFTIDSDEWFTLSQSGVSAGYGAQWVLLSTEPPREILVAYTEPNSPATSQAVALARGAKVLSVDGFDIDTNTDAGIGALDAGLFPPTAGETHTFTVQDVGAVESRSITMTSAVIESEPVKNVEVLETPTGRVGYMVFNDHIATAELGLINAVNQLNEGEGIDDLVLDIRYNGGGFLAIASELAFMIAGRAATDSRTFELTQFNDKNPNTDPLSGGPIVPTRFFDTSLGPPFNAPADQPLPSLNLTRVFVITSASTCSASEAVMNGLRGVDVEVIQIGTTTCGKPYGFYPQDNCGTTYFTIQFRGVNDKNFGDYADGFSPANTQGAVGVTIAGCSVPDDFTAALGDPSEGRLSAALTYRDDQTCPSPAAAIASKSGPQPPTADGLVPKSPWKTNRIMLP
jgi:C-terminal processing protease CtpA/Prc